MCRPSDLFRVAWRVACVTFAIVLRVAVWLLRGLSWVFGSVARLMSRRGAEVGRTFMERLIVNVYGSKSSVLAAKDEAGNLKIFTVRPY